MRLETTAYGEGPTAWQEAFDGFGCRRNLAGEGSFAADVRSVVEGESRAGPALAFRIAQDAYMRVGNCRVTDEIVGDLACFAPPPADVS